MNIKDEGEIFLIRVDQNNDSYFKAHINQVFKKSGFKIVNIYLDVNEFITSNTRVYKVIAENSEGTRFLWQKFENPSNTQIVYRQPDASDLEMINLIFGEETL